MKKTDNKKLINFVFFPKKLIKADFWKVVYPNKKKPMRTISKSTATKFFAPLHKIS